MRSVERKFHFIIAGVCATLMAGCGMQPSNAAMGALPMTRSNAMPASQAFRVLYVFNGGNAPQAPLLYANGELYGTTSGSSGNCGTVYTLTTSGVQTVLYAFKCKKDGSDPGGLTYANGFLYGTTVSGGSSDCGTIFRLTTSGVKKTLYSFACESDGDGPSALTYADGLLYGTTEFGGDSGCSSFGFGCGTVYSMTASGRHAVLHRFHGGRDGGYPLGSLLDPNGHLYGTTSAGGLVSCSSPIQNITGCGTVYSIITRTGSEKVLYAFKGLSAGSNTDGAVPQAGLMNLNGVLYGTTTFGGKEGCRQSLGCGIVFSLDSNGRENVRYAFAQGDDGENPESSLIDVSGKLYGTTYSGGKHLCHNARSVKDGCGVLYSLTPSGAEHVVYSFTGYQDGMHPVAPVVNVGQTLYGTTPAFSFTVHAKGSTGTIFAYTL